MTRKKPTQSAQQVSWSGPWLIHFFQRHVKDDPKRQVPGREFLEDCPTKIAATMAAVLKAVSEAPPPKFSGGGKWEAMHGGMSSIYEVRVDGPNRHHYRLFCVLERDGVALGLGGPSIVIITGKDKPFRTTLSDSDYEKVKNLAKEYRSRTPRSFAS